MRRKMPVKGNCGETIISIFLSSEKAAIRPPFLCTLHKKCFGFCAPPFLYLLLFFALSRRDLALLHVVRSLLIARELISKVSGTAGHGAKLC